LRHQRQQEGKGEGREAALFFVPAAGGNRPGRNIFAAGGVMCFMGKVKWFNESKGYGFIEREDGADVFVHYTNIVGQGFRTLKENDEVEFEANEGPKGLQAVNVEKV
jgi:cold shock protein